MLALAVRRLEVSAGWVADEAVSLRAWLSDHGRMSAHGAKEWVRRGRLLATYGEFATAALSHRLSAGQLEATQTLHQPKYEALLADQHVELVDAVAPLNASDTAVVCRVRRDLADAVIDADTLPVEPDRTLSMGRDGDGALAGRFVLDDAEATEFEKAIRTATTFDGDGDDRSHGQRGADALHDIAAFFNRNHDRSGTQRHPANITISVNGESVAAGRPEGVNDDDGHAQSPACTSTYLCDCVLLTIVRAANDVPTSFGRARYSVPRRLFRQIAARDGGCRFPGCDRPVRFTDAHHIHHWEHGGNTDYNNLVLLCNRHHHMVHRLGLGLKLLADTAPAHHAAHHHQSHDHAPSHHTRPDSSEQSLPNPTTTLDDRSRHRPEPPRRAPNAARKEPLDTKRIR